MIMALILLNLEVDLIEWDHNAEDKIIVSALYSYTIKVRELIKIVEKIKPKRKRKNFIQIYWRQK